MSPPTGTVTFLFSDIEGSTVAWERMPELMSSVLARHDRLLRDAIAAHSGYVFATGGDGFAVAFASVAEALGMAIDAQRALRSEPWPDELPILVRMAVNSGEVVERDGDYFGPAVNRTARHDVDGKRGTGGRLGAIGRTRGGTISWSGPGGAG